MKTSAGRNLKITAGRSHRAAIHRLFGELFGCGSVRPSEDVEIYRLGDGFSVGLFYIDDDNALTEEELQLAPWLEFSVDDLEAMKAALDAAGIVRVPVSETAHTYFQMPGGPVFRLAAR